MSVQTTGRNRFRDHFLQKYALSLPVYSVAAISAWRSNTGDRTNAYSLYHLQRSRYGDVD